MSANIQSEMAPMPQPKQWSKLNEQDLIAEYQLLGHVYDPAANPAMLPPQLVEALVQDYSSSLAAWLRDAARSPALSFEEKHTCVDKVQEKRDEANGQSYKAWLDFVVKRRTSMHKLNVEEMDEIRKGLAAEENFERGLEKELAVVSEELAAKIWRIRYGSPESEEPGFIY
ncbi:uncharacterized protein L3040_007712 [Drepanopeziza brunnea f. sp. 'multigermtubi']|uniref:Uncharacterized protein n=1 Tax=Marssonina brunnea f. sp. multigermtubi (strain MB_m1) TaxID=1072389 RepID=K1WZN4_MARBU|nr:uncharacterized protein MBM_03879 [Drepanopeziza brunnea f. sp. 'multigermtubi' MB_m1]EKD18107.1 hypothetical protein MBM_03879 [Drepanopeziza brunnea f. sp. 'multigermtubi' MB_m1]KAJ5037540.1 hypothetical protein L3040_007712 [Drepanopeziza brunnea f. sp. 'multigermtubi']